MTIDQFYRSDDDEFHKKPSCPEHTCVECSQKHYAHLGPVTDTGQGYKVCESCGGVTESYAPI